MFIWFPFKGVMPFGGQFGSMNIDHNDADQVNSAAAVLAKYIEDTGDQEGVVEFLQFMVKSGKVRSAITTKF